MVVVTPSLGPSTGSALHAAPIPSICASRVPGAKARTDRRRQQAVGRAVGALEQQAACWQRDGDGTGRRKHHQLSRTGHLFAAAALSGVMLGAGTAFARGPDTDCRLGDRTYRIRMPAGYGGGKPIGAIVFAHGYRGSAAQVMANAGLAQVAAELGVALIAAKSAGDDWSLPGAPWSVNKPKFDELAYFDRLVADVARRFPIDEKRLMASGFSAGGMMVWTLACHRSTQFAAFAPIAGTFWQPEPKTCTTPPASLIHIHGDQDRIVPLKGRKIGDTRQGDVPQVIKMYARYGAFGPPQLSNGGGLRCADRRNPRGHILNFCQFSGGHWLRPDHVRRAWKRFEAAGRL